ncbi:MAG: ATPase [Rhodobacterales bacterium]|nr:MAG: ATPase [Rhodobacterales bacterium]
MAHIIVVGNEKGGSGKSTTAMHVATALARMGHNVGALDLDLRQRSLGRYVENRRLFCKRHDLDLPRLDFHDLPEIDRAKLPPGENVYDHRLSAAVATLEPDSDFIVIDCPGSHTRLSQVAHSLADTLITPLNDSFVDFDLLAYIDPETQEILGPSVYAEMVWNARQLRAQAGLPPMDWVVVRNRLAAQRMHNKEKMQRAIAALAKRIGFRTAPGFGDRVIFRELFPRGLTLLDLKDIGVKGQMNISNVAARQELRELIKALDLPGVEVDF